MSVIRCKLIHQRSGDHNSQYVRTYTQKWRVETNDPLDGPQVVVNHSELPDLYESYSSGNDVDASAYLISKHPEEEGDSRQSWIVTCEYSSAPPADLNSNPLTEAAKVSFGQNQFTTIARQSLITGQRITNSIGQVFVPPPEVDQSRGVIMIRKNLTYVDGATIMDYTDSVNQTSGRGCPPRTAKCKSITTGELQNRNGIQYYEVTYEFHLNELTWDLRILNQATKYWLPGVLQSDKLIDIPQGSEPITIYVKNSAKPERGDVVSAEAWPMTPGYNVPSDPYYHGNAPADVVYLRYRYYNERNFGVGGLGV